MALCRVEIFVLTHQRTEGLVDDESWVLRGGGDIGYDGWNDAQIAGCGKSCGVFDDRFESGDTLQWSTAVP
jgi:hypothetical protein